MMHRPPAGLQPPAYRVLESGKGVREQVQTVDVRESWDPLDAPHQVTNVERDRTGNNHFEGVQPDSSLFDRSLIDDNDVKAFIQYFSMEMLMSGDILAHISAHLTRTIT